MGESHLNELANELEIKGKLKDCEISSGGLYDVIDTEHMFNHKHHSF